MSPLTTRTVAAAAALALTVGAVAFGTPADAATPTSSAAGRFLSGQAGGTNFDTVLALNAAHARYPGNPRRPADSYPAGLAEKTSTPCSPSTASRPATRVTPGRARTTCPARCSARPS